MQVVPATIRLAILTAILGVGGALHTPTILVYQNNVSLSANTTLADLTVATFDGYANVVGMTWNSPYIDVDGTALVFGASITIVATGGTTPNVCYGYAAVNAGVTTLQTAWAFTSPQPVDDTGDAVSFVPAFRYSGV